MESNLVKHNRQKHGSKALWQHNAMGLVVMFEKSSALNFDHSDYCQA